MVQTGHDAISCLLLDHFLRKTGTTFSGRPSLFVGVVPTRFSQARCVLSQWIACRKVSIIIYKLSQQIEIDSINTIWLRSTRKCAIPQKIFSIFRIKFHKIVWRISQNFVISPHKGSGENLWGYYLMWKFWTTSTQFSAEFHMKYFTIFCATSQYFLTGWLVTTLSIVVDQEL